AFGGASISRVLRAGCWAMGAGALCAECRSAHRTRATSRISTRHQHATLSTQHPAPYNFFVSQVSQLSPDLARGVLRLARALLAATTNLHDRDILRLT